MNKLSKQEHLKKLKKVKTKTQKVRTKGNYALAKSVEMKIQLPVHNKTASILKFLQITI